MAFLSRLAQFLLSKKQAYRRVFSGQAGELVLADLLNECQLDRNPLVPMDDLSTGERIGRQNVGRFLVNNLNLPDEEIIRRTLQFQQEERDAYKGITVEEEAA